LLFLESEFLAVRNYDIRTHIRDLLHFPLYHGLFATLACGLFLRLLSRDFSQPAPLRAPRPGLACGHVACFVVIALSLRPFADQLIALSAPLQLAAWSVVLVLFASSWLAAILPPSQWLSQARAQGTWLTSSVLLGGLSMAVMHASNWLWEPLARGTFLISGSMLELIYDDVISEPERMRLGTSTFHVSIEPGCSGYEGVGLVLFFGLVYLWIRRDELKFPGALLLLPFGMLFNWLLNTVRIATLVVIGTNISPDLALKGFHSQAGWLAFTATSLLLIVIVEELQWFLRPVADAPLAGKHEDDPALEVEFPAAPYLLPLLALLLSSIFSQAFTEGFDWSYPFRIVACAVALWSCRAAYRGWRVPQVGFVSAAGVVVYVLWHALVHPPTGSSPWHGGGGVLPYLWLMFRVAGSVVVIPIAEELAFRGYLLPRAQSVLAARLSEKVSWLVAMVVSSVLFGLLHQDVLAAILAGAVYALVCRRTSLGGAILAHGLTNACIAIEVLIFERWGLW
jgi:exosortase E/protease (VPEID-CTERM system)